MQRLLNYVLKTTRNVCFSEKVHSSSNHLHLYSFFYRNGNKKLKNRRLKNAKQKWKSPQRNVLRSCIRPILNVKEVEWVSNVMSRVLLHSFNLIFRIDMAWANEPCSAIKLLERRGLLQTQNSPGKLFWLVYLFIDLI